MSHETNLAACQYLVTSCLVLSNGCVCSYMTDSLQKFRIILSVHWWTHFLLNIVHQLRHVHMGHTKHIQVLGNRRHYWQPQREHSAVSSLAEPDSHTKSGRDGESRCVARSASQQWSTCSADRVTYMSTNDICITSYYADVRLGIPTSAVLSLGTRLASPRVCPLRLIERWRRIRWSCFRALGSARTRPGRRRRTRLSPPHSRPSSFRLGLW